MITQYLLKRYLHYDPDTGVFTWLERQPSDFSDGCQTKEHNCMSWNKRNAGKAAGSIHGSGYIHIRFNKKSYSAHILAWIYMTGKKPNIDIDHKNNNKVDNRFSNLRLATESQNVGNSKMRKNNKSGLKGIFKSKRKWRALGSKGGKKSHLGYFDCPAAAHFAYVIWAHKSYGEFMRAA